MRVLLLSEKALEKWNKWESTHRKSRPRDEICTNLLFIIRQSFMSMSWDSQKYLHPCMWNISQLIKIEKLKGKVMTHMFKKIRQLHQKKNMNHKYINLLTIKNIMQNNDKISLIFIWQKSYVAQLFLIHKLIAQIF